MKNTPHLAPNGDKLKDVLSRGTVEFKMDKLIKCSIVLIPVSLIKQLDNMQLTRAHQLGITLLDPIVAKNDTKVLGVNHEQLQTSWSRILKTEIQLGMEVYKPYEKDLMLAFPVSYSQMALN